MDVCTLQPYLTEKEYLSDLQRVLEEDYEVDLIGEPLREAGENVSRFLGVFL